MVIWNYFMSTVFQEWTVWIVIFPFAGAVASASADVTKVKSTEWFWCYRIVLESSSKVWVSVSYCKLFSSSIFTVQDELTTLQNFMPWKWMLVGYTAISCIWPAVNWKIHAMIMMLVTQPYHMGLGMSSKKLCWMAVIILSTTPQSRRAWRAVISGTLWDSI